MGQRGPNASTVTDGSEDPFHKRADPPKLTHFNQVKTLRFILTIKNKNKTGIHFFICFFLFLKPNSLSLSHHSYAEPRKHPMFFIKPRTHYTSPLTTTKNPNPDHDRTPSKLHPNIHLNFLNPFSNPDLPKNQPNFTNLRNTKGNLPCLFHSFLQRKNFESFKLMILKRNQKR